HYEPILWFSKTDKYTYHQIREPYKSQERLKSKIVKNGKVWTPNPDGKHSGDVWNIPVLAGKRFEKEKVDHPTQKPMMLCDRIVKHFSNPDDHILVPFCGSGSECVSAKQNGRHYISYEINDSYIQIAQDRLEQVDEM
ncbi:DNA-methyltransferase, partial [Bacteroidota bacterium]